MTRTRALTGQSAAKSSVADDHGNIPIDTTPDANCHRALVFGDSSTAVPQYKTGSNIQILQSGVASTYETDETGKRESVQILVGDKQSVEFGMRTSDGQSDP